MRLTAIRIAVVVMLAAAGCADRAADDQARKCGVTHADVTGAPVPLTHASDFGSHFPNAPVFPELADNQDAAVFVVFTGSVEVVAMGVPHIGSGTPAPRVYPNAVCVIVDGVVNLYPNVNLQGS